jgi:hypothetical protein
MRPRAMYVPRDGMRILVEDPELRRAALGNNDCWRVLLVPDLSTGIATIQNLRHVRTGVQLGEA